MNNWSIIGRLGKDAESRVTTTGTKVVNFNVALEVGWGERAKTMWVRCKWFGDSAAKVAQYIRKGDRIGVIGSCELETWDSDGKTGAAVVLNVREVTLCSDKKDGAQPATGAAPAASTPPARQGSLPVAGPGLQDDEIPF